MTRVMRRITLGLLGAGVALGLGAGPASAASCSPTIVCNIAVGAGDGGTCNGYIDSGCTYCSDSGSPSQSNEYWCDNGYTGYHYQHCSYWVDGTCLEG